MCRRIDQSADTVNVSRRGFIGRLGQGVVHVATLVLMHAISPSPVQGADESKPLASAKHSSGLVVEILSVSRDDTREQLKVTWRYTNPTKKAIRILKTDSMPNLATLEGHAWQKYWNGVKYTEVAGPAGNKTIIVHQVMKTANWDVIDGTEIRSKGIEVPAEGEFKMYARFDVPQKEVDHITLKLPEVEEFENLSISVSKGEDPKKTAKHSSGLVVEILSVSRDDTREQLKVTWRYTNSTKKAIRILKTDSMPNLATVEGHAWQGYWNRVEYMEVTGPAGKKKIFVHGVVRTKDWKVVEGTEIRSEGIEVPAEGEFKMFARFSVPQKGVDRISVKLPEVGYFENLTIDAGSKEDN